MGFKLGSEKRKINKPDAPIPVFRKNLAPGIRAEANNDGTIFVDKKIPVNSPPWTEAVAHELQHMEDMDSGRAQYGDDWVMWEGKIYIRKTIDGQRFIDGPAGRLPEGHKDHPWEQSAIQAEGNRINVTQGDGGIQVSNGEGEEGDSPMKWFGKKLWNKAKESKVGKFALGGGVVGAAIRGMKDGGGGDAEGAAAVEAERAGKDPCAECEASEGGDGDARSIAGKLMGKAKRDAPKPFFQRLKEAKGDPDAVMEAFRERGPGGFGNMIGGMFSDRRLKKDIKLVGESPSGLKIYTFKYIDEMCDNGIYEGVMSDEIPASAVIKHNSGYDMVDYSQLDVDFKRI